MELSSWAMTSSSPSVLTLFERREVANRSNEPNKKVRGSWLMDCAPTSPKISILSRGATSLTSTSSIGGGGGGGGAATTAASGVGAPPDGDAGKSAFSC